MLKKKIIADILLCTIILHTGKNALILEIPYKFATFSPK